MAPATQSRRERLRMQTAHEIKATALRLMADGGPEAIALRAVAREMGMTAGAIYGYYATRDELVDTLIGDVYGALVDAMTAARDAYPVDDTANQVLAWAQAFREWAVANPEGFRLIYGDPIPGYTPHEGGPAAAATHRACAGLAGLVASCWDTAASVQPAQEYQWSDFHPSLVEFARVNFPDLPPAAIGLALRVWGRMHGLVSLEIYGHLREQTLDPGKLYRTELLDLIRSLGLGTE